MNLLHRRTSRYLATVLALMLTSTGLMAQQKALLFGDSFNRANSTNLNESADGQSGSLGALNYATRTFTAEAVGPVVLDINNNTLRIDGPASEGTYGGLVYIDDHNFTDAVITTDGGFSITVDIAAWSTAGNGRYMSVGVGQTLAELEVQTGVDPGSHTSDLLVSFRRTSTQILEITKNGVLDATETVTGGLPAAPTTMRIEYALSDFNAGSTVTYEVFFDDDVTPFTSGSFIWSGTDENYISLASNLTNPSRFDNLEIRGGSTASDFTPPNPDPLTWETVPTATSASVITMTATTAYDDNGVEYYFKNTTISDGSHDSGWQSGTSYTDTNLTAQTLYAYTVMARDKSENANETTVTMAVLVTTPALDNTPPNPDPMTWDAVPAATSFSSISMTATVATDTEGNGVEYYFACISGDGDDSGWQSSPDYTDSGLDADTAYSYAVQARDNSPDGFNETGFSTTNSATTDGAPTYTRIAGVDFEGDDGSTWDAAPDDLDGSDGITVSAEWTVFSATSNAQTVIKQDNGADGGAEFGFDGATPETGETARSGKLNLQETSPANPPATTPATYFSWSITVPAGEFLNLGDIRFKWRQGTGTAATRWGMFNTNLDGGPDGGTPLWTLADPPNRNEAPNFETEIVVDLSDAKYQGLTDTTVTFYWYTERTGSDIDTIIVTAKKGAPTEIGPITMAVSGTTGDFTWFAESGGSYELQVRNNLEIGGEEAWTTITTVPGANADITVSDDLDDPQGFYRVKLAE